MPDAVYIHIPFCEHICTYCDFNKYKFKGQPVWEYLEAVDKEMAATFKRFPTEKVETIFVGGGTPTVLSKEQMAFFLNSIQQNIMSKTNHPEFTIEANPENVDREKLNIMKAYGVNRLSLGVQTFDEHLLKTLGRKHTNEDVLRSIRQARDTGFDNLSIDLMYRLPDQTLDALKKTLKMALELDIDHLSVYSLQVEPRTIFYNRMRRGGLSLPSEDEEADMYVYLLHFLEENGWHRYEISNFAKLGFESRHNQVYWKNKDYYGIGAGAHSYIHGVRRVNAGWSKKYIRLVRENDHAFVEEHRVSTKEQMEDKMFLGLRLKEGVSKEHFKQRFGTSLESVYGEIIERLISQQFLVERSGYITLTEKGLFLGNEVFQEFLTGS